MCFIVLTFYDWKNCILLSYIFFARCGLVLEDLTHHLDVNISLILASIVATKDCLKNVLKQQK